MKPARYGVNASVDVKSVGIPPEETYKYIHSGKEMVLIVVESVANTNCNFTGDN